MLHSPQSSEARKRTEMSAVGLPCEFSPVFSTLPPVVQMGGGSPAHPVPPVLLVLELLLLDELLPPEESLEPARNSSLSTHSPSKSSAAHEALSTNAAAKCTPGDSYS